MTCIQHISTVGSSDICSIVTRETTQRANSRAMPTRTSCDSRDSPLPTSATTAASLPSSSSSATLMSSHEPKTKDFALDEVDIEEAPRRSSMAGNDLDVDMDEKSPPVEERREKVEMIDGRPKDIYDRFTPGQKRRITAIVSYSSLIARMSTNHHCPIAPCHPTLCRRGVANPQPSQPLSSSLPSPK
jgi:hypothetical protein